MANGNDLVSTGPQPGIDFKRKQISQRSGTSAPRIAGQTVTAFQPAQRRDQSLSQQFQDRGIAGGAFFDPEGFARERGAIAGALGSTQGFELGTGAGRAAQEDLLAQILAQARGEGPSLARQQFQQAGAQNLAQTLAAAASQRGVNPALAQRQALSSLSAGQQGLAGQTANAVLQERLAAQQQAGGLAQALEAQDVARQAQQQQLRQQALLELLGQQQGLFGAEFGAGQAGAELAAQQDRFSRELEESKRQANRKRTDAIIAGIFGLGGEGLQAVKSQISPVPTGGG